MGLLGGCVWLREEGAGKLMVTEIGDARIVIPTLLHEEHKDCQRQLTHQNDSTGFIHAIALMRR
jgi:hypothetical protein